MEIQQTEEEKQIEFVKLYYPTKGSIWCADQLNVKPNRINHLAKLNKLYRIRRPEEYKVNHLDFINIDSPQKAYILGLIWTDGYVSKNKNAIVFSTTKPDDEEIIPYFSKTGWSIYYGKTGKRVVKTPVRAHTTNKYLNDFLKEYNFCNKKTGMDKIYNNIPDLYKRYFLIGLVDGDGCFSANDEQSSYRFSICSEYEQNWKCLEGDFNHLKIPYNLERALTKNGNYSKIHLNSRKPTIAWGDYLYQTRHQDGIGLKRKYEKYLHIKKSLEKTTYGKKIKK